MKKVKKLLAVLIGAAMMLGLVACGASAKGEDKTYTVSYDNTMEEEVLAAIPEYQFVADNLSQLIAYGTNLDITLELKSDGTYSLESKYYNQDVSISESDPGYMDISVKATGTYTSEEGKVTISAAETATATYQGGSYITEQGMFVPFSFNDDGSVGEWSSDDVPEVLKCVPETTFTVTDAGAITAWEAIGDTKGNPHATAASDNATDNADAEVTGAAVTDTIEADSAAGFVMTSPEWDAVSMTFHTDGTFKFEETDHSITEEGTWSYAEDVLTVTKSDGSTAEATIEDGTMKLSYVSVTSDQMIGDFESTDWNTFFK